MSARDSNRPIEAETDVEVGVRDGVRVRDGVGVEISEAIEVPEPDGPESGEPCTRCGAQLSVIRITVDGNTLLMESCDGCDARRWQLAGERIDLQEALTQVGEHAGRRR